MCPHQRRRRCQPLVCYVCFVPRVIRRFGTRQKVSRAALHGDCAAGALPANYRSTIGSRRWTRGDGPRWNQATNPRGVFKRFAGHDHFGVIVISRAGSFRDDRPLWNCSPAGDQELDITPHLNRAVTKLRRRSDDPSIRYHERALYLATSGGQRNFFARKYSDERAGDDQKRLQAADRGETKPRRRVSSPREASLKYQRASRRLELPVHPRGPIIYRLKQRSAGEGREQDLENWSDQLWGFPS